MGNFRDNRSGGRSFGRPASQGGRDFRDRGSDRPEMHKAICSECGKECMVPFRPTGSKPVFCSNCFEKKRGSDSGRSNFRRPDFENKPRYDQDSRGPQQNTPQPQYDKQFDSLNAKLDKILKILTPVVPTEVVQEKKIANEVTVEPIEQKVVPEKKKRVSKKATPTPKE